MKKIIVFLGVIILSAMIVCYPCDSGDLTKTNRNLSLKVLEGKLQDCLSKGYCPDDIVKLCGITKVLGYVIDARNNDIVLVGKVDNTVPPLYLEDFVIALRNVWLKYADLQGNTYQYTPPGCSIDPDPEVWAKLHEAEFDENRLDEWRKNCEQPQKVRVLGIPFYSRFAKVMVEADYLMKRINDGSFILNVEGFESLTDMELKKTKKSLASNTYEPHPTINRFEFYPGVCNYKEDEGVALINRCQVTLITEEEFMTKTGNTIGSGKPDPLAKEYVDKFTEKYEQIARKEPIYCELEGLYRFVALTKLMKHNNALSVAKLPLDYLLNQFPIKKNTGISSTLVGISNIQKVQHRTEYSGGYSTQSVWSICCGGVSMDVGVSNSTIEKDRTGKLREQKEKILTARPDKNVVYWDSLTQLN